MGAGTSAAACTQPVTSQEEYRLPWALSQAERFESEDCPFCALRRSHCAWLRTEIKRLTSEVASLETTIPPKFYPELEKRLEEFPLPDSAYTGGVDDIRGTSCPRCTEHRKEVRKLQREARALDAQCKARIEFHRCFARRIEALLIDKRRIEAQLMFGQNGGPVGTAGAMDGHLCSITKVNQPDDDVVLSSMAQTMPGGLFRPELEPAPRGASDPEEATGAQEIPRLLPATM